MRGLVDTRNGASVSLVNTTIRATLLDIIGEVELEQTYVNNSNNPIEATYKFPLDGNNAVHKFVATVDGVVIVAKVMEKNKAAAVYDDAISAGKGAYLLEQKEDNVMQISVGNLPPTKSVTLTITYVQELLLAGKDELLFSIPSSLYSALEGCPEVHVTAQMPLPILQITTPQSQYLNPRIEIRENNATISLPSSTQNPGNISFLVKLAKGIGAPRLWMEQWDSQPTPSGVDPLAVMLALSPDIDFKTQPHEIIFVLDRSGSMSGGPTQQLIYTMYHALKFIPSRAFFNIVCFGSSHEFLFPASVPPTFENLFTARRLIAALPELGGTELLRPLQDIYSRPTTDNRKRHILVLTDGQISDNSACISLVRKNKSKYTMSTIGIGDVDKKLVQNLADAAYGKCEIILSANIDSLENIMSGLLQMTLEPAFDTVNIIWYDDNGEVCKNVKKAPEKLPPMYAGDLYKVFAMVTDPKVRLSRAQFQALGKAGKLNMDISLRSEGIETTVNGKLIHLLAAKQLIRELDEGAMRNNLSDSQKKKEIIKLSVTYNLASPYTSFVAVEDRRTPVQETMQHEDVNDAFVNSLNLTQLNEQFRDLSAIVQEQGMMIDSIESNVASSGSYHTSQGVFMLQAASVQQKSRSRRIFIIILAILFFPITLVILLVILLYKLFERICCK